MTGQATGFWKVRHAVVGIAVLGSLVLVMNRSCSGDAEHATHNTAAETDRPPQGVYVQVPASQLQPRYAELPQTYPQPAYGYVQQPAYGYVQQPVQPQAPAVDPENPWASPVPRYPQQPAQWGQPQQATQAQVPQWGQPQQVIQAQLPQWGQPQQQETARLSGDSRYRPLDSAPRDPQPSQTVTVPMVPVWSVAPYDRRGGSSFGNTGTNAWSGGYAGYGYNPGYGGVPYGAAPWPGGYAAGFAPGAYPGAGWPGRW